MKKAICLKDGSQQKLMLLVVFLFLSGLVRAQEASAPLETEPGEEEEVLLPWRAAFSFGYTFIPKGIQEGEESEGKLVPSIGLDLWRRIGKRWGVLLMADLELANYLVKLNREDLRRDRAFLLVLAGTFELRPGWELLAGGGIELEKHENLAILRLGTGYEFELGKGWGLGPAVLFDFKEGIDTWTLAASVSKRF